MKTMKPTTTTTTTTDDDDEDDDIDDADDACIPQVCSETYTRISATGRFQARFRVRYQCILSAWERRPSLGTIKNGPNK